MQTRPYLKRFGCILALVAVAVLVRAAGGQEPEAAAPAAPIWTSDIHDTSDGAIPGRSPAAIAMVGTRGGIFSGKVVLASGHVAKAAISDLKQGDAVIPASAAQVRYGVLWDQSIGSWTCPRGKDMLFESPPEKADAKLPIWVTVKLPRDVKAGVYSGQLAVEPADGAAIKVPVTIDVRDWTLPDPQDYRTWVELVHQPDTLALEYDVPMWSEEHWKMIAKTLDMVADTGSRVIYIPLIARTNYGNSESMVRWIKKGENSYEHDFAILDRYLDLVAKHLGKPKITFCYAWEVYLVQPEKDALVEVVGREGSYEWRESSFVRSRQELKGKGPAVTVVDPATGQTDTVYLPRYEDPASKALWQPVWSGLRQRLAKRGWDGSMMLANVSDRRPTKEETQVLNDLSGGLPWTNCSHHLRSVLGGKTLGKVGNIADIGYAAVALDFQFTINPKVERAYGWQKPILHAQYWRFQYFNTNTHSSIRNELECNITGCQRGIGHLGADFWPCIRNKAGRRAGTATDRYPESYWHSLNVGSYLLAPGPTGPVGTSRMEVFREGLQQCEARIFIETALTDDALRARLGADLARRAQEVLDEQHLALWKARGLAEQSFQLGCVRAYRTYLNDVAKKGNGKAGLQWFLTSGWADRAGKIFTVAGEVARKLGKQ